MTEPSRSERKTQNRVIALFIDPTRAATLALFELVKNQPGY